MEKIELSRDDILAIWDWESGEMLYDDILQFAHDLQQILNGDTALLEKCKKDYKFWLDLQEAKCKK